MYVEITVPDGFGGNSVFCHFVRFNKMQNVVLGRGKLLYTPGHVQSSLIQYFSLEKCCPLKCQETGALEAWVVFTDVLQAFSMPSNSPLRFSVSPHFLC